MKIISTRRAPQTQVGVGLIEVLIAVLVLAVGVLGMAALQATTLKNSGSSAARTQAMVHTYEMADALRANRKRVADLDTGGFVCANDYDEDALVKSWLQRLTTTVDPSACGNIICATGSTCVVGVRWDDSRATAGSETETVQTDVRM